MPQGAMDIATEENVGPYQPRGLRRADLQKNAAFFEKYCGIAPEQNSKNRRGTLVCVCALAVDCL
jgi:hypothetical protein